MIHGYRAHFEADSRFDLGSSAIGVDERNFEVGAK